MISKKKRKRYKKTIAKFCLMDDTFMAKFFENNIEGTEYLLHLILEDDKIKVEKVIGQYSIANLQGHSRRLDIYAVDGQGNHFNVEVQRTNSGAIPQRARYHADMIDVNHLAEGADYAALKDTYVIFITENDVLQEDRIISHIERTIQESGRLFHDGSHIVYVNGAKRGNDSELARLMEDFFCINPDDMHNEKLAQRARYLKFNEGGVIEMCELMEELAREEAKKAAKKAAYKNSVKIAKGLLEDGISIDIVAKNTELPREKVEAIAKRLGKLIA